MMARRPTDWTRRRIPWLRRNNEIRSSGCSRIGVSGTALFSEIRRRRLSPHPQTQKKPGPLFGHSLLFPRIVCSDNPSCVPILHCGRFCSTR